MDSLTAFFQDLVSFPLHENPEAIIKYQPEKLETFSAAIWIPKFIDFWPFVWIFIGFYVLLITMGQAIMSGRSKIYNKNVLACWNTTLAVFSIAGFAGTIRTVLFQPNGGLLSAGWERSVCTHPSWYGHGISGFFVCCFIASKILELIDTLFLVLGKRPVIFLHWYHHITVLLFCWHAYSKAISTGVYFACINYGVHSIMYSYYALTQLGCKRVVRPIAPYITIVQMSQMIFGLAVILGNLYYSHMTDVDCHHDTGNNICGLLMYVSYFLLFLKLYLTRFAGKSGKKKTKVA